MEKSEEKDQTGDGQANVDSRAPFKSVKEAVMLFGEKVLVREIYANKLKQMQDQTSQEQPKPGPVKAEPEEAKRSLDLAREEANTMASCLQSLREELHQTKRELQQLKTAMKEERRAMRLEIEHLRFVERSVGDNATEFQVKKLVRFASPASLVQQAKFHDHVGGTNIKAASFKECHGQKKKKGSMMLPAFGWIFTRKRSVDGEPN
ncbi:hypothetical protein Droror1_Dr00005185 [Drosera rotundifolia]